VPLTFSLSLSLTAGAILKYTMPFVDLFFFWSRGAGWLLADFFGGPSQTDLSCFYGCLGVGPGVGVGVVWT
jgi:hypothetical protein